MGAPDWVDVFPIKNGDTGMSIVLSKWIVTPFISRARKSRKQVKKTNLLISYDHFHGHPSIP